MSMNTPTVFVLIWKINLISILEKDGKKNNCLDTASDKLWKLHTISPGHTIKKEKPDEGKLISFNSIIN